MQGLCIGNELRIAKCINQLHSGVVKCTKCATEGAERELVTCNLKMRATLVHREDVRFAFFEAYGREYVLVNVLNRVTYVRDLATSCIRKIPNVAIDGWCISFSPKDRKQAQRAFRCINASLKTAKAIYEGDGSILSAQVLKQRGSASDVLANRLVDNKHVGQQEPRGRLRLRCPLTVEHDPQLKVTH